VWWGGGGGGWRGGGGGVSTWMDSPVREDVAWSIVSGRSVYSYWLVKASWIRGASPSPLSGRLVSPPGLCDEHAARTLCSLGRVIVDSEQQGHDEGKKLYASCANHPANHCCKSMCSYSRKCTNQPSDTITLLIFFLAREQLSTSAGIYT
jgi:hypothetical protein